jgi:hypothetical protein
MDPKLMRTACRCLPCGPGTGPSQDSVPVCESCSGTQFSVEGACNDCEDPKIVDASFQSCTQCAPGTGPNAGRTACHACLGARYSPLGYTCDSCAGNYVVNAGKTS